VVTTIPAWGNAEARQAGAIMKKGAGIDPDARPTSAINGQDRTLTLNPMTRVPDDAVGAYEAGGNGYRPAGDHRVEGRRIPAG